MLLTVKKQIEETLEVKTPCYYKSLLGFTHLNAVGQLIAIRDRMIFMWEPSQGTYYTEDIERMIRDGVVCTKEEFEKAYAEVAEKLGSAAGLVTVNS